VHFNKCFAFAWKDLRNAMKNMSG